MSTSRFLNLFVVVFDLDLDSQVLSWQHRVVEEFAARCETLTVLTEHLGRTNLPRHVRVVTVPRILQRFPFRVLGAKFAMIPVILVHFLRNAPDAAFFHMNYEWAYRLAPLLRLRRVPAVMWYAHGAVTWRLRLALRCVTRVLTSTPEGFRIASPKVKVIGQGIDTEQYYLANRGVIGAGAPSISAIVCVGRISPVKEWELTIRAFAELIELPAVRPRQLTLHIIGASISRAERDYAAILRAVVKELRIEQCVVFHGKLPAHEIAELYRTIALLNVSLSSTGSMDKTGLEALAVGCPFFTTNPAFAQILSRYPECLLRPGPPLALAQQLASAIDRIEQGAFDPSALRKLVIDAEFSLPQYINRVSDSIKEVL